MNDALPQPALQQHLDQHLDHAALSFRLDEQLGFHHGLSWSDFVLLAVLDAQNAPMSSPALAKRLGLTRSRLVLQVLPLEKIGLVTRSATEPGMRSIALRPVGRRLLHEARDTAASVCAARGAMESTRRA